MDKMSLKQRSALKATLMRVAALHPHGVLMCGAVILQADTARAQSEQASSVHPNRYKINRAQSANRREIRGMA